MDGWSIVKHQIFSRHDFLLLFARQICNDAWFVYSDFGCSSKCAFVRLSADIYTFFLALLNWSLPLRQADCLLSFCCEVRLSVIFK